jgi:hypothetical protein
MVMYLSHARPCTNGQLDFGKYQLLTYHGEPYDVVEVPRQACENALGDGNNLRTTTALYVSQIVIS